MALLFFFNLCSQLHFVRITCHPFGTLPGSSLPHAPFTTSACHSSSIATRRSLVSKLLGTSAIDLGYPMGTLLVGVPCPVPAVTCTASCTSSLRSPLIHDRVRIGDRPRGRCSSSSGCLLLPSRERTLGAPLRADNAPVPPSRCSRVVPPSSLSVEVGRDAGDAGDRAGLRCLPRRFSSSSL